MPTPLIEEKNNTKASDRQQKTFDGLFSERDDSVTDSDLIGAAVESDYDGQFDKATNQALNLYARTLDEIESLRVERNDLEAQIQNMSSVEDVQKAVKTLSGLSEQIDKKTTELMEQRQTSVLKNALRVLRNDYAKAKKSEMP